MNGSIFARLVTKDLYLYRGLILGTLAAGLVALPLSGREGVAGMVGSILLVTALVVHSAFLALHSLFSERKSRSLLFVLSLPLSPLQYAQAKISACLIAFMLPWGLLLLAIVGLTLGFSPEDTGKLPAIIVLMGLLLANFCLLIGIALVSDSEVPGIAGIIVTNTSIPVLSAAVLPRLAGEGGWNSALLLAIGVEATIAVGAIALALHLYARKSDFV
jgi:hypothetical protein